MKARPDLVSKDTPDGVEVFQLTEGEVPCSHVYMEAQIFAPDSKRFVLHRSAHAHGSSKDDPEHRYLVCDLDNGGVLTPITAETGATGPSLSPDGAVCYYFVNETETNGGRLTLKRVGLDGTGRETVLVIDAPPHGAVRRPSRIYPLSTISSDGKRMAQPGFFGDGIEENAPWGLMVIDLERGSVEVVLEGPTWLNLHPQYCRSTGEAACHDVMVQENHGCAYDLSGACTTLVSGKGADIHVIADDGTGMRNLPWGRDGDEFCQGHQCWRGCEVSAITSTSVRSSGDKGLVESAAVEFAGHVGLATPGGVRSVLSRTFPKPSFSHFATDMAGLRFISDARVGQQWLLYTAEFGGAASDPLKDWTFVLDTRSNATLKTTHPHPFLSPDGTRGFFNSDESGTLHAYMVTGLFGEQA